MSDLDTLFERLRSQRWEARKAAAQAMAQAGAPAVKYLTRALSDENPDLRLIAAKALGWMKSPAVATALVGALADEDAGVRKAAAEALAKTGGAGAVASLILALMDEDWSVREAAAEALGVIGDAGAIAPSDSDC